MNINGSNTSAAGLAWVSFGTLSNVYVSGTISAFGEIYGNGGTITRSHAAAKVSGGSYAGGISGGNVGLIQNSYVTGSVSGVYAGGITGVNGGENLGTVSQCYSTAIVSPVSGGGVLGGLVGRNEGVIANSYTLGQVNGGGGGGGGAVGTNDGSTITAIYSTALVFGSGGLVGVDNTQTFSNSYWDLDTSGINNPHQGAGTPPDDPGITGLTDDQLRSGLPEGFDPKIWDQKASINGGYPYLRALPPS